MFVRLKQRTKIASTAYTIYSSVRAIIPKEALVKDRMPMQKTYKQYYKELRSHPSILAHILYVYNFTFLYCKRSAWGWRRKSKHIAHERAIVRNPPIHNFTADRKKLDIRMLCFYENIRSFIFLLNTVTEDVFVRQLSAHAGISVWRVVWVKTNCYWMSDMLLLELMYVRFSYRLFINKGCVRQCKSTVCFPYELSVVNTWRVPY